LINKNYQRVATEFLTRLTRQVSWVFNYPYFFINPARFQPRVSQVSGQPTEPSFKSMICHEEKYSSRYKISLVSIIVCIPALLFPKKKILNERRFLYSISKKKIVAGDVSSVAIIFWWLKNQD
jgi:hypothetical protein